MGRVGTGLAVDDDGDDAPPPPESAAPTSATRSDPGALTPAMEFPTPRTFPRPRGRLSITGLPEAPEESAFAIPPPAPQRIEEVRALHKRALAAKLARSGKAATEPDVGTTRTAETIQAYRTRGDQLLRKYRLQCDLPLDVEEFDAMHFANWLLAQRSGFAASTWRIYRISAVMKLGELPDARAEEARALLERQPSSDPEMSTERQPVQSDSRLTSANKAKEFPYAHWHGIESHLRLHKRAAISNELLDWLRAGLATGLRPGEWEATDISHVVDPASGQTRIFLYVLNAKATNGRGNGVLRTLEITDLTGQSLGAIERMSRNGARMAELGRYIDWQRKVSQALYRLAQKIVRRDKTVYSLYSTRHQFVANMRSLSLDPGELAALVGHNVDETAHHHYGQRRSAWGPERILDRPRGVPEEIATVTIRLRLEAERKALINSANSLLRDASAEVPGGNGADASDDVGPEEFGVE